MTTSGNAVDTDAIRRRHDASTEGIWQQGSLWDGKFVPLADAGRVLIGKSSFIVVAEPTHNYADAEFIGAAHDPVMQTKEEQLASALASATADNPDEIIDEEDFTLGFDAAYALGYEARAQLTPVDISGAEDDFEAMMDLVHLTAAEMYSGLPMLDHNTRLAIAIGRGVDAAIAAGFKRNLVAA